MTNQIDAKQFGQHLRSLRKARGRTQRQLARASDLSADTVRRIELGTMSASIQSIAKFAAGLELPLSTVFESYELGDLDERKALVNFLANCSASEVHLILRVAQLVSEAMDE